CLSSWRRWHLCRDAWHGRVFKRVRPETRAKNQTGCPRHPETGRSPNGWPCSYGQGLARPSLRSAQGRVRRETTNALPTQWDRKANRPVRNLRRVVCPETAQQYLASNAQNAWTAADF